MKSLLKYTKLSGIFLGVIMIISLVFGLLNLIGVSYKVTMILEIIVMVLLFFAFGVFEGLNTSKKGFIAGFKISLIFLVILILINLIFFRTPIMISRIIYYMILLCSGVFGATIGINRKKKE